MTTKPRRKKSIEGWICLNEKIEKVLVVEDGFITIDDNFSPCVKKEELYDASEKGYKKVRITIEELK